MFKGFLSWFVILCLLLALLLYIYGRKTLSNMTTAQTAAYVESTTDSQNWVDYVPSSNKFKAKFPKLPQHAVDRSKDTKTQELKQYEMYVSENNGQVFMISVISFLEQKHGKDDEIIIKNVIDDMVSSNSGNKLEKIQFEDYKGLKDAIFVISNNNYSISGLAFVKSNQLYVLSTLAKTPEESKKEFDYFIKSFDLNKNATLPTHNEKIQ